MAKSAGALSAARNRRQIAREIAAIKAGGFRSLAEDIRPEGKAPRGRGQEYAARRTIANILETMARDLAANRRFLSTYRGQKNQARRATIARARVQQLTQAYNTISSIARSSGDWVFKLELIRAVRDSAAASFLVN